MQKQLNSKINPVNLDTYINFNIQLLIIFNLHLVSDSVTCTIVLYQKQPENIQKLNKFKKIAEENQIQNTLHNSIYIYLYISIIVLQPWFSR